MTREVAISGRVIDAKTEEPLRGLGVTAHQYRSTGPGRFLSAAHSDYVKTGQDGRFRIERIAPGDYYLEVSPPYATQIGAPKPVEDFRHAVERNYARSWYPGIERVEEALPVKVVQGVDLEGVEIKIEKRRTAAIRGRILSEEGETAKGDVHLSLTRVTKQIAARSFEGIVRGDLKIGSEFEIDRLSPGTYHLEATAEDRSAAVMLQVGEENQDGLDLYLSKGVAVTGRVRIEGREDNPDEPALPSDEVRVELERLVGWRSDRDPAVAQVASKDGSFTIERVIAEKYRLRVLKPPAGYAVSEVRYNRRVCPNGIIAVGGGAGEQQLEVKLAPATGSVVATVTDGSRPSAGATVLLVPERVEDEALDLGFALREAKADTDGRATFNGLLPGAYRMTAYPAGALWGDDPDLKQRLATGEGVRVAERQTAQIQVRAQSNPNRQ
jgi:hypothetical protein